MTQASVALTKSTDVVLGSGSLKLGVRSKAFVQLCPPSVVRDSEPSMEMAKPFWVSWNHNSRVVDPLWTETPVQVDPPSVVR
jgi:hypothetical protein